jgi:glycerol kinase
MLGVPVIVPKIPETTALGAAYLAGIGTGLWDQAQVAEMWEADTTYEPAMDDSTRQELLGRWREAVERAKGWAEK